MCVCVITQQTARPEGGSSTNAAPGRSGRGCEQGEGAGFGWRSEGAKEGWGGRGELPRLSLPDEESASVFTPCIYLHCGERLRALIEKHGQAAASSFIRQRCFVGRSARAGRFLKRPHDLDSSALPQRREDRERVRENRVQIVQLVSDSLAAPQKLRL